MASGFWSFPDDFFQLKTIIADFKESYNAKISAYARKKPCKEPVPDDPPHKEIARYIPEKRGGVCDCGEWPLRAG